jgi:acetyltransferase EpsM
MLQQNHLIAIIGAGGHARVVRDVCEAMGLRVAGFIDPSISEGTQVDGLPVLGGDELLTTAAFLEAFNLVPGIGNEVARHKTCLTALAAWALFSRVRHPSAVVSPRVEIGVGTVLVAGAIVNAGSQIGRFCIINTGASIDHDCVLEDAVQIAPRGTLCGNVRCGEGSFIGAGAVILPGISVGPKAIIGAGTVVTRNISSGFTALGNPARIVK